MFRTMLIAGLAAACWTTPTMANPGVAAQVEAAERAFAADGLALGIRDSFLKHMADDAIMFAPGPVNARTLYDKRPSSKTPKLEWWPQRIIAARSGELALSVSGHPAHAHDLAGVHGQGDAVERCLAAVALGAHAVDAEHDLRTRALDALDGCGAQLHVSTHHEASELAARRAGDLVRALGAPGPQDGDAVRDRADLVELVRDEDDGAALGRHAPEHLEEGLRLLRREHGGGLVEDEQLGLAGEGLDDLDALLLADRELPDPGAGVHVKPVALAQLGDPRFRSGPSDAAVLAEHHVLGDGERLDQAEVLVHHADARLDRVARRVELHRQAVQCQRALVGSVEAGQAVGERRLAGAVLAEEGVDLPGCHVEVDGLVGDDAAGEPLRDVARGECRGRTPGTRRVGCRIRHEDVRTR